MAEATQTQQSHPHSTPIDFLGQLLHWRQPFELLLKIARFAGFLQEGEILRMTSSQEFREFGVAMVNYIADYLDNIRDRPVVPKVRCINQLSNWFSAKVSPGYLAHLQPATAPQKPEHWKDIMEDIEKVLKCCENFFSWPVSGDYAWGDSLAPPTVPCLLPHSQQLPWHRFHNIPIYTLLLSCGHALRRDLLHRFLLAGLPRLH